VRKFSYDDLEPQERMEFDRLERRSDALAAVCRKLAKIKTGPAKNKHAEWIDKVLALAAEARAAAEAAH
jgi:hypothetical protein